MHYAKSKIVEFNAHVLEDLKEMELLYVNHYVILFVNQINNAVNQQTKELDHYHGNVFIEIIDLYEKEYYIDHEFIMIIYIEFMNMIY